MDSALNERKAALRKELRHGLATVADRVALSARIVARLLAWDRFVAARSVMTFVALPDEVDLSEAGAAVLARGSRLFLPRVDWKTGRMDACRVTDMSRGMVRGRAGLLEPPEGSPTVPATGLDLILVPGLGFDARGGRIGRGAGFYDRFLAPLADASGRVAKACGIGFDAQVAEEIPMGPMDIRLGAVATDSRLILT